MSEYLSHAAVYDDVRRLALRHDGLPEAFHSAFRQFPNYGRAGSVTRGNYEHVVPMLAEYRTRWTARRRGHDAAARVRDGVDQPPRGPTATSSRWRS